jgi:6-phosphogluconolactonase
MTASRLTVRPGADDQAIAKWLAGRIGAALAGTTGRVAISLPGGSTPFPILAALAAGPGRGMDFRRVIAWPGDDRMVPADHPASNYGRIFAALAPLGIEVLPLEEQARPPHFVLVWLGMGEDGHIASLFPSSDPRTDDPLAVRRLTPDPLPPEAPFERLSLTMPALLDSDELMFVIRGEAKRALFEAAAKGENDLPVARLLAAARGPVTCFT